ncbi:MAG: metallophosphoesterase [Elusimicrobia bacterium]|nr:metallophosphoesterase [Elusimicrobiota bacterium]
MKRINCCLLFVFCFASIFPIQTVFSAENKTKKTAETNNSGPKAPPQIYRLSKEAAAAEECLKCIVVYGDTRTNHGVHKKIEKLISGRKPETIFHTGDMVSDGANNKEWDMFEEIVSGLRKNSEFFPVHGNHEWLAPNYFKVFGIINWFTYYSIDRHKIHFTVIDSEVPFWKGTWQYQWLESDLKKASLSDKTKFIAVLLHRPLYSSGLHGAKESPVLAQELAPLFEKYGVDIVVAGHDHDYERLYKNGIFYITAGGGGAPLYDKASEVKGSQVFIKSHHYLTLSVLKNELFFETFNELNEPIDSFKVKEKNKITR